MKSFFVITSLILLLPLSSQAKVIKKSELPWLEKLAEHQVEEFNVCGNSKILPTKKSISKNFITGPNSSGYLFTNLLSYEQYFKIISEKNLVEAKAAIENEFNKTHLWKYSEEKGFEDLGVPSQVNSSFSATIKDCMEGAKTTLGNNCSHLEGVSRRACCREKFIGPEISWEHDGGRSALMYSPDPSTHLKVNGEKKHRYCNVQETIRISL